jgi:chromosomal replication initiator protein
MTQTATNWENVWGDCLGYISRRIKKQSYDTWFRQTKVDTGSNGQVKIVVPNRFVADWLAQHYNDLIEEALRETCSKNVKYEFRIDSRITQQTEIGFDHRPLRADRPVSGHRQPNHTNGNGHKYADMLNNRYRFENLVVGNFNQFACAAAKAVAEGPGHTKYNPLYVYGGVGLGKTHLLQAIGHYIRQNDPEKKVFYATSERFTSDFINSISTNTTSDFSNVYRGVDVLLIDDTQFFAGKESTQEQFFHTFNSLHNAGKQIVLSSDRAPRDIKGMEERLLSRFSWGLVTDIQPPDLETRAAILQRKVEQENIEIEESIITFIANSVTTNIRDLEGSLIRLLAYASVSGEKVSVDLARQVLGETFGAPRKIVSIEAIKKAVSEEFGVTVDLLSAKKKTQNVALARQSAMYLTRELTQSALKGIGDAFGGRDHSTVIHACNLINRRLDIDPLLKARIDKVKRNLLR